MKTRTPALPGSSLKHKLSMLLACLLPATLPAQILEIRVEGTIKSNLASPGPESPDSNVMGYERIWAGGMYQTPTASPFSLPTASVPTNILYSNKSYSLVDSPFKLSLLLDTRLLPAADLGSGPASTSYSDQLFGWFQSPSYQPYTPWLTAKLTINGVTQSYTGDHASFAALSDDNAINPLAPARSRGNFTLNELSSPIPAWNAGYYDVSGINLQFSFLEDILNGTNFIQPLAFSTSDPLGLSGVSGNFSVWETTFNNYGQRLTLAQDTGLLNATSFALRSFNPDQPVTNPGTTPSMSPVPEPSTYGLMGTAALGAASWLRRRRRQGSAN